jgi:CheY-like chemotaxis protein
MSATVLIADDNPADIELLVLAFEEQRLQARLLIARDGLQAIECLDRERPHLVLLDIKMPRADGFEVLAALRLRPALADVPVIMMSSSTAEHDRRRSLALGATRYWVKPSLYHEALSLVGSLPALVPGLLPQ